MCVIDTREVRARLQRRPLSAAHDDEERGDDVPHHAPRRAGLRFSFRISFRVSRSVFFVLLFRVSFRVSFSADGF